MPSSTLAAVSHASTAASSDSKMSFQRITTIGSMPSANSDATASRTIRSASFSSRWISTRWAGVAAVVQPGERGRELVGRADEHVGDLLRRLHRRLDAVAAELVGGLLGEVDDVVERAGQRVHVGRLGHGARAPTCGRRGGGCRGRSGRPRARTRRSRRRRRWTPGSRTSSSRSSNAVRWTLRPDSWKRSRTRGSGSAAQAASLHGRRRGRLAGSDVVHSLFTSASRLGNPARPGGRAPSDP